MLAEKLSPGLCFRSVIGISPGHEIECCVGVVNGYVDIGYVVQIIRWDQCGGRGYEHSRAYILAGGGILDRTAQSGIAEAIAGTLDLHARRFVRGRS
ncbi:hypothetical protein D3C75_927700 [compost metagenome]